MQTWMFVLLTSLLPSAPTSESSESSDPLLLPSSVTYARVSREWANLYGAGPALVAMPVALDGEETGEGGEEPLMDATLEDDGPVGGDDGEIVTFAGVPVFPDLPEPEVMAGMGLEKPTAVIGPGVLMPQPPLMSRGSGPAGGGGGGGGGQPSGAGGDPLYVPPELEGDVPVDPPNNVPEPFSALVWLSALALGKRTLNRRRAQPA